MLTLLQVMFVLVTLGLPIVTLGTLGYVLFASRSEGRKGRKTFVTRARPASMVSETPTRA